MPDETTDNPPREPRIAIAASWCCLIASFALSAITWIALGRIAGYGHLAYLMPFVVDAYVIGSIVTWLQPVGARVARFAYYNMYGAAILGVISQAAYHCASVYSTTNSTWQALLALIAGSIPPMFAFLGVHLRGLARRELHEHRTITTVTADRVPEQTTTPPPPAITTAPTPTPTPPTPPAPAQIPTVPVTPPLSPAAPTQLRAPAIPPRPQTPIRPRKTPHQIKTEELEQLLLNNQLHEYARRQKCSIRTAERHRKDARERLHEHRVSA